MSVLPRLRLASLALCALLPLALCAEASASGGPLLDLEGSSWELPEVKNRAKAKAKVKKGGKAKVKSTNHMSITFGEGGTWSGQLDDGIAITGTYTRANESSRVLDLTLDPASIDALEEHEAALAEASLAEQGVIVNVFLSVAQSKFRVRIRTQKKAGTATLTLMARFKFQGNVTLPDTNMFILKASARLRGKSLPIALDGIIAD